VDEDMACISKRRNRYVIDFYDNHGKRRWHTMPKGCTKKKSIEKLREIEDQVRRGIYLQAKEIPTFGKVAEDWLEYKKLNLRESTYDLWAGYVKNHYSEINDLRVNRIVPATVEKFIVSRQAEGMHIATLRKVLMVFGQIMQYAVRHRYVDHNPVRDAEKPRNTGGEETPLRILTPSEVQRLLAQEKSQKYRTIYHVAVMTGARQGEILGLKWGDLELTNAQIHIQRTTSNGKFFVPKTPTSVRRVDLGPSLMAELKKWKLACPRNALDIMFPNEAGKPIEHHNLMRGHFVPALEAAGLPRIRFHDLRHTNASIRLEEGQNIKYISTQLGHANPTITLNTYSHLIKARDPEAASRLEKAIFEPTGSKTVAEGGSEDEKGATVSTVTP
jgi:integrase